MIIGILSIKDRAWPFMPLLKPTDGWMHDGRPEAGLPLGNELYKFTLNMKTRKIKFSDTCNNQQQYEFQKSSNNGKYNQRYIAGFGAGAGEYAGSVGRYMVAY